MAKVTQEGVELTGLGYVVFHWADEKEKQHTVRWRRPSLREYRELRNLLQELGRGTQDLRDELQALMQPINDYELAVAQLKKGEDRPEAPEDPDWEVVDSLREQIADFLVPWTQRANALLAVDSVDGSLPEDLDDWPAWAASSTLPSEIIAHYRNVPKAPGAKGTNTPQESGQN